MPHCNAGSYVLLAIGSAFLLYAMVQVYRIMSLELPFSFTEDGAKTVTSSPFLSNDQAIVFAEKSEDCDAVFASLSCKWDCRGVSSDKTDDINSSLLLRGYCYNGVNDDTFPSDITLKKDCSTIFQDNYTIVANFSGYDYNSTHCSSCPRGPGQFTVTSNTDIWVHWKLDTAWQDLAEAVFGVIQLIAAALVAIGPLCCCFCACTASCIVWLVSSPPPDPAAMQQAQVQMGQMPAYGMQQPMGYPQQGYPQQGYQQ